MFFPLYIYPPVCQPPSRSTPRASGMKCRGTTLPHLQLSCRLQVPSGQFTSNCIRSSSSTPYPTTPPGLVLIKGMFQITRGFSKAKTLRNCPIGRRPETEIKRVAATPCKAGGALYEMQFLLFWRGRGELRKSGYRIRRFPGAGRTD